MIQIPATVFGLMCATNIVCGVMLMRSASTPRSLTSALSTVRSRLSNLLVIVGMGVGTHKKSEKAV